MTIDYFVTFCPQRVHEEGELFLVSGARVLPREGEFMHVEWYDKIDHPVIEGKEERMNYQVVKVNHQVKLDSNGRGADDGRIYTGKVDSLPIVVLKIP